MLGNVAPCSDLDIKTKSPPDVLAFNWQNIKMIFWPISLDIQPCLWIFWQSNDENCYSDCNQMEIMICVDEMWCFPANAPYKTSLWLLVFVFASSELLRSKSFPPSTSTSSWVLARKSWFPKNWLHWQSFLREGDGKISKEKGRQKIEKVERKEKKSNRKSWKDNCMYIVHGGRGWG